MCQCSILPLNNWSMIFPVPLISFVHISRLFLFDQFYLRNKHKSDRNTKAKQWEGPKNGAREKRKLGQRKQWKWAEKKANCFRSGPWPENNGTVRDSDQWLLIIRGGEGGGEKGPFIPFTHFHSFLPTYIVRFLCKDKMVRPTFAAPTLKLWIWFVLIWKN